MFINSKQIHQNKKMFIKFKISLSLFPKNIKFKICSLILQKSSLISKFVHPFFKRQCSWVQYLIIKFKKSSSNFELANIFLKSMVFFNSWTLFQYANISVRNHEHFFNNEHVIISGTFFLKLFSPLNSKLFWYSELL